MPSKTLKGKDQYTVKIISCELKIVEEKYLGKEEDKYFIARKVEINGKQEWLTETVFQFLLGKEKKGFCE